MCGIFACVHQGRGKYCVKEALLRRLKRRGPDSTQEATISVASLQLDLLGTLLCMRGAVTPQPLTNDSGDHFMWNGNVFGGCIKIGARENDTAQVLEALSNHKEASGLLSIFSKVHGPWAFAFWQQSSTSSLWFGRDVFGRRSLVWHLPTAEDDTVMLSSVGHFDPIDMPLGFWLEVPATGIFQLRCLEKGLDSAELVCYPWMQEGKQSHLQVLKREIDVCFQSETEIIDQLSSLKSCLHFSIVKERSLQVPFPKLNKQLPSTKNCDSNIVTFLRSETQVTSSVASCGGRGTVQDPTLSFHGSGCLVCMDKKGSRQSVSIEKATLPTASPLIAMATVTQETDWNSLAQHLLSVLQQAIQSRVDRAPRVTHTATQDTVTVGCDPPSGAGTVGCDPPSGPGTVGCGPDTASVVQGAARVAILFSGGVDSVVLAALTDRCVPPCEEIDLINVAFGQKEEEDGEGRFEVPDRVSAIQSLGDLNPQRKWNLVLVNVTLDEVNAMRKKHVSHLIYPLCTVLDDSIGCALWFSARGHGLLYHRDEAASVLYQTRARTLFVGIGADEQLAGYSRHRTKFKSEGWRGLVEEVEMDVKRLARRNLGRDDRCIADHQREGQFPFLDEEVVGFLQQLPIWSKADLSLPRGTGEKRLLREAAVLLGCHGAATLPKRAIQFGSRMARLAGSSNSREHGSDICKRLLPPTSS